LAEVRFHPAAVDELSAAFDWYLERSPAAASSFLDQFEQAISRLMKSPDTWPRHKHGTRRYILRLFPFQVIYLVGRDTIEVVAVAHDKRKPGYWAPRVAAI